MNGRIRFLWNHIAIMAVVFFAAAAGAATYHQYIMQTSMMPSQQQDPESVLVYLCEAPPEKAPLEQEIKKVQSEIEKLPPEEELEGEVDELELLAICVEAEAFQNAGYAVSEPGDRMNSLGATELRDEEGLVAICVRNTPKERIPDIFDILLGCRDGIIEWVNQ